MDLDTSGGSPVNREDTDTSCPGPDTPGEPPVNRGDSMAYWFRRRDTETSEKEGELFLQQFRGEPQDKREPTSEDLLQNKLLLGS